VIQRREDQWTIRAIKEATCKRSGGIVAVFSRQGLDGGAE
jgi:hypothetical protein